jgi:nodulation protein E
MTRVVITGVGLVTPLGKTWDQFSAAVHSGRSAIASQAYQLDGFPDFTIPVAAVMDFDAVRDVPRCKVRAWDRLSHFALYAARQAAEHADVEGAQVDALILGSSTTSVETLDENYWRFLRGNGRISPMMIAKSMPNAPVSAVSIDLGIRGMSYAIASACSSANHALISTASLIKSGAAKVAIAGGVEASLSFSNLSAWSAMQVLSQDTCRPFCETRSGLVMGEGAVLFILEEMENAEIRGAHIYAELLGWGQSSDAKSLTTPDQSGIALALQNALKHAAVDVADIDYINAHGTATDLNDTTEAGAITEVFGTEASRIAVTSTKALHGHLLGGAGAIELAATLAGMEGQFVPPNAHMISQDTTINLNIPSTAVPEKIRIALSASYAFGGHNSVLVIGKGDEH